MFLVDIQFQVLCDGLQQLFPIDVARPTDSHAPAKIATFSSSSSFTNVSTKCAACLSMLFHRIFTKCYLTTCRTFAEASPQMKTRKFANWS